METDKPFLAGLDAAVEEEFAQGLLTPGPVALLFWAGLLVFAEYQREKTI